ncbi:MAG: hypothetical protein ACRD19_11570 [Terriglobia bacterium]
MNDALEDCPGGPIIMPRTRRSIDEQLESLRQKKEALEKQLDAVEARKKETDRKLDTRRKIIVGGAVLAHAEIDPAFCDALQMALQKAVSPKDRPLVMDLMRHGGIQRAAARARDEAAQKRATAADRDSAEPPPGPGPVASGKPPGPAPGSAD